MLVARLNLAKKELEQRAQTFCSPLVMIAVRDCCVRHGQERAQAEKLMNDAVC